MRGLLPPTPSGTPPGGGAARRSACPIAWRGRATSRKIPDRFPTDSRQIPDRFPSDSPQIPHRFPTHSHGLPVAHQLTSSPVCGVCICAAYRTNINTVFVPNTYGNTSMLLDPPCHRREIPFSFTVTTQA
eukprot:1110266-Prorocentrum_minimum.AAC.3